MLLEIRGSHLTCKVANKCLNVCERAEIVERNKYSPLPFATVLWAGERKPWQKKCCRLGSRLGLGSRFWIPPPRFYLKRDSGAGVFLWNLRNFQEYLFYRTPPGDCFWRKLSNASVILLTLSFIVMLAVNFTFHQISYKDLDFVTNTSQTRSEQTDYQTYVALENLLLIRAANNKDFSKEHNL